MISSKISRRYAKALLSIGQEDKKYKKYGKDLIEFSRFCSANKEFFGVISNQIFPVQDRKNVLEFALEKGAFSDVVKNFLRLLLDKNRLGGIVPITDYYAKLTDELSNITRADITTARPLKKKALGKLEKALRGLTSKEIQFAIKEDDSLIGGLVVKIGDLVLDGSVKAKLEGLRESLK